MKIKNFERKKNGLGTWWIGSFPKIGLDPCSGLRNLTLRTTDGRWTPAPRQQLCKENLKMGNGNIFYEDYTIL